MSLNEHFITAGLAVAKDAGQRPNSQINTAYVTAGLAAEPKVMRPKVNATLADRNILVQGGLVR